MNLKRRGVFLRPSLPETPVGSMPVASLQKSRASGEIFSDDLFSKITSEQGCLERVWAPAERTSAASAQGERSRSTTSTVIDKACRRRAKTALAEKTSPALSKAEAKLQAHDRRIRAKSFRHERSS
jgi:hypothetical protein